MLAITMGDPSGIGPEVTLKGFSATPRRFHIGDPAVYHRLIKQLGLTDIILHEVSSPAEAYELPARVFAILPTQNRAATQADFVPLAPLGKANPAHAAATVESIQTACQLAKAGHVSAMVTPPINKAVLHEAGFDFPGHTELLAQCAGVDHPVMMLAGADASAPEEILRVVPTTIHQSINSVSTTLTPEFLRQTIQITYEALRRDFALAEPRIVVTGLNPHAGEEGAFGREEVEIITPVCQQLEERWPGAIRGPVAADSLFHRQARQSYDAVVCMYHDQALIPLKMLAFGQAINITLGLPIVRTSVDHGTAYNIAGQGVADPGSFIRAVEMAALLVHNRQNNNR